MTNYTADQINRAVRDFDGRGDGWYMAEYWESADKHWSGKDNRGKLDIDGVTEYAEFIDGQLGEEGGPTNIWMVIKVGDQLFKKHGAHISHDGTYWDGSVQEVRPVEKLVTVYERK